MDERFLRNRMLLGQAAADKLRLSHVAVFGLGGVGSFAVEGLARAGVGKLTLIDHDTVGLSNTNRQLCAVTSAMGRPKADVMAERVRDINPDIEAVPIAGRYTAEDRERFWDAYDYILDAIDLVTCKLDLILSAKERGVPILSALGTGNKLDPTRLTVCDISKTINCPLAKVMRKELRYRGVTRHRVVYSPELAIDAQQLDDPPPGRRSVPASVCWVPGCAGLMMAGECVRELTCQ